METRQHIDKTITGIIFWPWILTFSDTLSMATDGFIFREQVGVRGRLAQGCQDHCGHSRLEPGTSQLYVDTPTTRSSEPSCPPTRSSRLNKTNCELSETHTRGSLFHVRSRSGAVDAGQSPSRRSISAPRSRLLALGWGRLGEVFRLRKRYPLCSHVLLSGRAGIPQAALIA